MDAFRVPEAPTWADVAAFCCLIDRVGKLQIEEMLGQAKEYLGISTEGPFKPDHYRY